MKSGITIFFIISLISTGIVSQSRIQELQAHPYRHGIVINYLISKGNSCTGYQIQRAGDTLHFETIYDYSGICGESSKAQAITFSDEHPEKNAVNYYRVLIPPSDQSQIISVIFRDLSEIGYLIYENPVGDVLKLVSTPRSKVKIYNQTGHLDTEIISNEDGSLEEDISSLDSGMYYFSIESAIGQRIFGKFIKK
ncbi:MAG: T9SS type A sorting domain-containing protein [Bacteroidota bacterium]